MRNGPQSYSLWSQCHTNSMQKDKPILGGGFHKVANVYMFIIIKDVSLPACLLVSWSHLAFVSWYTLQPQLASPAVEKHTKPGQAIKSSLDSCFLGWEHHHSRCIHMPIFPLKQKRGHKTKDIVNENQCLLLNCSFWILQFVLLNHTGTVWVRMVPLLGNPSPPLQPFKCGTLEGKTD